MLTEQITVGGVSDMSSDNNWKVVQRGAGANMSVDVSAGKAFVTKSGQNTYPMRNTATANVLVASNSSGNPRIDAIVLYADLAATANSDASNVGTLVRVQGTPAASPSAPSDADISTAIGANNPFIRLANVTVANGAASILTANISDQRRRFRYRHSTQQADASDGATTTYDVSKFNYQIHALGGNRTLAVTGESIGDPFFVELRQPGAGGPYTVTWWGNIDWDAGVAPTLTITAGHIDVFGFLKLESGRYRGFVMLKDGTNS